MQHRMVVRGVPMHGRSNRLFVRLVVAAVHHGNVRQDGKEIIFVKKTFVDTHEDMEIPCVLTTVSDSADPRTPKTRWFM